MKFENRPKTTALLIALFSASLLLAGCIIYEHHDDDEGEVLVCNYDNHEYCVVLYDYYNDRVEDEFWVEEWYDYDRCDEFRHIDEGRYYIAIYRECDSYPWDVSENFYIDEDEFEYFWIDEDGDIHRD